MSNTQIAAIPDRLVTDPPVPDGQAEIADGIVHDLNNVFSSLAIATHLLQQEVGAERRRSLLASLERATARGQELLDELARHGDRRDDEEIELDVRILLEAVARAARARLGARLSLVTSYEHGLPRVTGDPSVLFSQFFRMIVEVATNDTISIRCRLLRGPRVAIGEPPEVEVEIASTEGTFGAVRLSIAQGPGDEGIEEAPAELWDDSGATRLLLEHPAH